MQPNVGRLIRRIREDYGHSQREAADFAGLDRNLLRRLESNCRVRRFDWVVEKFAAAYHINAETLLRGNTPLGAFRNHIAGMPPALRATLIWAGFGERLRFAVAFLISPHGGGLSLPDIANAAGLDRTALERGLAEATEDTSICRRLAQVLTWKTGLPMSWFTWGVFSDEAGFDGAAEYTQRSVSRRQSSNQHSSTPSLSPINCLRVLCEGK